MAIRFVDDSTGNDANDGLDNIGVGLATATWTEATFTLTQAGHGYTFATGDVIYISGGTGATVGLYEVTSSTANDIVLVETSTLPDVGNASDFAAGDLATGDITSSDGPDLTIQASLTATGAGDHVWIRASGTYGESITGAGNGDANNEISIEGYTTSLGDDGIATNDGTSTLATGMRLDSFNMLKNFRAINFTGVGIDMVGSPSVSQRVRSNNNGSHGFQGGTRSQCFDCYSHDNSSYGFNMGNQCILVSCISWGNGQHGFEMGYGVIANCLSVSDVNNAVEFVVTGPQLVLNCTIDGDAKDTTVGINYPGGLDADNWSINNIVYDCATGISSHVNVGKRRVSSHNLLNNNTADYSNFGTDDGEVTAAPSFVNEGTDYTPAVASPAINAGIDLSISPWGLTVTGQRTVIGAIERVAPTGGGGLLMPNKRGGKQ